MRASLCLAVDGDVWAEPPALLAAVTGPPLGLLELHYPSETPKARPAESFLTAASLWRQPWLGCSLCASPMGVPSSTDRLTLPCWTSFQVGSGRLETVRVWGRCCGCWNPTGRGERSASPKRPRGSTPACAWLHRQLSAPLRVWVETLWVSPGLGALFGAFLQAL